MDEIWRGREEDESLDNERERHEIGKHVLCG